jgi:RHS repeat-associated protein
MMMPGRKYSASGSYRYGFNGKENDNEVKGEGNQQDYGMRIYDPRLGKFLSVDPLTKAYPWYTPYQFAGNMPIWAVDLDGLEPAKPGKKVGDRQTGTDKEKNARTWEWDGTSWKEAELEAAIVKGTYKHQLLAPIVRSAYDDDRMTQNAQMAKDIVKSIWDNSEIGKKIMSKIPGIPGVPGASDIAKKLSDKFGPGLYKAAEIIVKNQDMPIDMAAEGIGLVNPAIALFNRTVIASIVNDMHKQDNLYLFQMLDNAWRNTDNFNAIYQGLYVDGGFYGKTTCMIKKDYVSVYAVTQKQFDQVMKEKFFYPSDYHFGGLVINRNNFESVKAGVFNGEAPRYYIYFNNLGNKGFLHISEIGYIPIIIPRK